MAVKNSVEFKIAVSSLGTGVPKAKKVRDRIPIILEIKNILRIGRN